jgi:uncharacterized protein
MLQETFIHLPGIGTKREARLWSQGVKSWGDLVSLGGISPEILAIHELLADEAAVGDLQVLGSCLRPSEHWRALCLKPNGASAKPSRWLALDIETTGLGRGRDHVTAIGLCGHATDFKPVALTWGLDDLPGLLQSYLNDTDTLVTFFGKGFDVPFLDSQYPALKWPPFHLDLTPLLRSLGLKGGLKKIQQALGLCRPGDIEDADGYTAVLLWRAHQRGQEGALDTLVRYCMEDVVVLLPLAELAYNQMSEKLGRAWRCWSPPNVCLESMPYMPELVERVNAGRRDRRYLRRQSQRTPPADRVVIVSDETGGFVNHPGYERE